MTREDHGVLNSLFLVLLFVSMALNTYMIRNNTSSLDECSNKLYRHLAQQEVPKGIR